MKILKFLLGAILVIGVQQRLPAPPATPVPTYYGFDPISPDGLPPAFVEVDESYDSSTSTYSGEVTDWDIPTPDGTLTPGNSTLAVDFFLSPTLIPLDELNFTGPGNAPYSVDLGPSSGSLIYPGGSIAGTWQVPDNSNALLMLSLAAAATVACNLASRKSRKA